MKKAAQSKGRVVSKSVAKRLAVQKKPKPQFAPPSSVPPPKPNDKPSDNPNGKHAGGRPSKLTDAVIESLGKYITEGLTFALACQKSGISYITFRNWRIAAVQPDASPELVKFLYTVTRAETEARLVLERRLINEARHGDWRCNHLVLRTRYPEDWADKTRHEHTGPGGGPIQTQGALIVVKGTPEEYISALRQAREAQAALTDGHEDEQDDG